MVLAMLKLINKDIFGIDWDKVENVELMFFFINILSILICIAFKALNSGVLPRSLNYSLQL